MDEYKGLISIMRNQININDVLRELRIFVKGNAVYLRMKSTELYSDGDVENMKVVSTLNRMRYELSFDVDYNKFNIQPFIRVLEGVLGVDSEADEFLVTMSHEIRNPLHGVTGYTQLLLNTNLDKEQKGLLRSLTNCSLQLMQIINDVLDLSRLNSGRMQIQDECFLFNDLQDQVTSILSQRIKEKSQTLVWRTSDEIPEYIISDKQRIVQILINLISNAHKFSDTGKVIQVVFGIKSPGILTFQVIDDGVGIPSHERACIFKPFRQVNQHDERGSGLGLTICKSLCMLMGGDISVSSIEGTGSVFSVNVKFSEVKEEVDSSLVNDMTGMLALVISDMTEVRLALANVLDSVKADNICFATVEEGAYYINKSPCTPDVVIIQDSLGSIYIEKLHYLLPLVPLISIGKSDTCLLGKTKYNIDVPICSTQVVERLGHIKTVDVDMNIDLPKPPSPIKRFTKDARILICEDSSYNRDILSQMLGRMGFTHVDSVSNGAEAIDMIDKTDTPYDLLYLDLTMPVIDGYGVIRYIHDRNMELPKIIVVTASVIQGEKDRCRQMGVNYFLRKPYSVDTLGLVTFQSLSSMGFQHTTGV